MAKEKKPIVEILDVQSRIESGTQAKQVAEKAISDRLDLHQNLIYAVLVVVAVGFIAIVIAAFDIFIQYKRFDAEKYSEYTKMIEIQNNVVDSYQNNNLQLQVEQLRGEIDNLWKDKYPIRK
jgi:hypothetical protein